MIRGTKLDIEGPTDIVWKELLAPNGAVAAEEAAAAAATDFVVGPMELPGHPSAYKRLKTE